MFFKNMKKVFERYVMSMNDSSIYTGDDNVYDDVYTGLKDSVYNVNSDNVYSVSGKVNGEVNANM